MVSRLAKMTSSHNLLRHHKIVLLRPVHSFRTLNISYAVATALYSAVSAPWTDDAGAADVYRCAVLLHRPLPNDLLLLFGGYFWAVSFYSSDSAADAHNRIRRNILCGSTELLTGICWSAYLTTIQTMWILLS